MPVPPAVAAGAERLDAICPGTVDEGYVRPAEQLIEPRRELFICGEVEPLVLDVRVDDVYRDDSMNETISLSDRFGLIIQYYAPDQKEYLAIIDHMLRKEGIKLTPEELRIAGVRWEMTHSGRSGRTAQQFVAHYLGQLDDHDA